jgi:hypothetical protein
VTDLNDLITRDLIAAFDEAWRPVADALITGDGTGKPMGIVNTQGLPIVENPVLTYSHAIVMSQQQGIDWGLVEPPQEEAADIARRRAEYARAAADRDQMERVRRRVAVEEHLAAYRRATDPTARAVLRLHQPDLQHGMLVCRACAMSDDDGEVWNAEWACDTARLFGL